MERDALLLLLRLKGYVQPGVGGLDAAAADRLVAAGLAEPSKLGFRLTAAGREAADAVWAGERARLPERRIEELHAAFLEINPQFKGLVGEWQQGGDADALLAELESVHARLTSLLDTLSDLLPRLSRYAPAFRAALDAVRAGNRRYLAAPLIDSYHTLWFELHEELIRLSGRTRAGEAAGGRAA